MPSLSSLIVSRRKAVALIGAVATLGSAGGSRTVKGSLMVIDGSGDPASIQGPVNGSDLEAAQIADVLSSKISDIAVTVGPLGSGPDATFDALAERIAWYDRQAALHPNALRTVRSASDLRPRGNAAQVGMIYTVQDTAFLGRSLDRLIDLHESGVRIVQLTYNLRNHVGDGCLSPDDGGLSTFGHEMVAALEARRFLVDLSHGGRRTTMEAVKTATRPPVISHTGAATLAPNPRNAADEAMRLVAAKGGVVGVYLMPFLRQGGQATREDVVRHLSYILKLCGEDHVGIGTDGTVSPVMVDDRFKAEHIAFVRGRKAAGIAAPGEDETVYNFVAEYNTPDRISRIADDLARRGYPARIAEKVVGSNFGRVFASAWG